MANRKTKVEPPSTIEQQEVLYIPQLSIPYEITNHANSFIVPRQIDEGMFRLRTPIGFSLDKGRSILLNMGIKFQFPKFIDTSVCKGIPRGFETSVFPRCIVHGHIDSIFELLVNHGITVLGPRVLSADIANGRELDVFIQNNGKKMFTAKPGDEIAEIYFTITPVSTFRLVIEQDL